MRLCPECSNLNPPGAARCECGFTFPPPPAGVSSEVRRVDRMLLGALASVAFGLLGPQLVGALWAAATGQLRHPGELWSIPLFTFAALIYVGPVWVAVLVPLYFLVPRNSLLWKWPVCTALGALAGAGLAELLLSGFAVAAAAVIGGATCLFGSLTRGYFQRIDARPASSS